MTDREAKNLLVFKLCWCISLMSKKLFCLNLIEILHKYYYINVKCFLNKAFLRNRFHIAVSTPILLHLCTCSVSQKLHYFQPRGFYFGRILILRNDWSSPWEEISLFKTKQSKQTEKQTKHSKEQPTTLYLCLNLVQMEIKVHKHHLRHAEAFIKILDEY